MDQTNKIVPAPNARALEFVAWIIPEHDREKVIALLSGQGLSNFKIVIQGLIFLRFTMLDRLWDAFSLRLCSMEFLALGAALFAQPINEAWWIAVGAGLVALTLCDAHSYLGKLGPIHRGMEAMFALTIVLVVEMVVKLFVPEQAVSANAMMQGIALGLLTVSAARITMLCTWRRILGGYPPSSTRMTRFITYLLMTAACVLLLPKTPLVYFVVHNGFPFGLAQLSPVPFAVSFKLRKNNIGGIFASVLLFALEDHETQKLIVEQNRTFADAQTPPKPREFPWHRFCEILSYALYCSTPAIALFLWEIGRNATLDGMGGVAFASYSAACLSLAVLWRGIRLMNQDLADRLQAEIDKRKKP